MEIAQRCAERGYTSPCHRREPWSGSRQTMQPMVCGPAAPAFGMDAVGMDKSEIVEIARER